LFYRFIVVVLVVIILDGFFMELALFLPYRKTPAADFPKLLYYGLVLQSFNIQGYSYKHSVRSRFAVVLSNSSTRAPLGSVGVQPTKNLLFSLAGLFPTFLILD